jgi:hypothetical protein
LQKYLCHAALMLRHVWMTHVCLVNTIHVRVVCLANALQTLMLEQHSKRKQDLVAFDAAFSRTLDEADDAMRRELRLFHNTMLAETLRCCADRQAD